MEINDRDKQWSSSAVMFNPRTAGPTRPLETTVARRNRRRPSLCDVVHNKVIWLVPRWEMFVDHWLLVKCEQKTCLGLTWIGSILRGMRLTEIADVCWLFILFTNRNVFTNSFDRNWVDTRWRHYEHVECQLTLQLIYLLKVWSIVHLACEPHS